MLSIDGKNMTGEGDLRQALRRIGPGKTQYTYRRGNDIQTVAIDCRTCKPE
jgi:S1-C subfamily serine protease